MNFHNESKMRLIVRDAIDYISAQFEGQPDKFYYNQEYKNGVGIVKVWLKPLPLVLDPSLRLKRSRLFEQELMQQFNYIVGYMRGRFKILFRYEYNDGVHIIKFPPRPALPWSAFLHYQKSAIPKIRADNPEMNFGAVAKHCCSAWQELSAEEHALHQKTADEDRCRYFMELKAYNESCH